MSGKGRQKAASFPLRPVTKSGKFIAAFGRLLPLRFPQYFSKQYLLGDGVIPFYLRFAIASPSIFYGWMNVWFYGDDWFWIVVVGVLGIRVWLIWGDCLSVIVSG